MGAVKSAHFYWTESRGEILSSGRVAPPDSTPAQETGAIDVKVESEIECVQGR